MRFLFILLSAFFFVNATPVWQTDFDKAQQEAREAHRYVLLNFSGSDWCIPCIKLHKEVFENAAFQTFAGEKLVLVNADFPRLNKNRLSKEQQKKNEKLADRFNPEGHFPYTVLLDGDGKVVKTWDGYPASGADGFTSQLKALIDAR